MGFLANALRTVAGIAGRFLGIPAAPAITTMAATAAARAGLGTGAARTLTGVQGIGATARTAVIAAGAGTLAGRLARQIQPDIPGMGAGGAVTPVAPGTGVVMGGDLGRGNGQFARQTIVQTIRLSDGAVVRSEVFSGAPFLMQKAVRELRATSRKLTKANQKIPRKLVRQSKRSALLDSVLDQALAQARKCP